jgi:hypothetical protein
MAWGTTALFVENEQIQQLLQHPAFHETIVPMNKELHYNDASSSSLMQYCAVGQVENWAVIWDPNYILTLDRSIYTELCGKNNRVFGLILLERWPWYGFAYAVEGSIWRFVLYDRLDILYEEGAPLLQKRALVVPEWGMDESILFPLWSRLTGLTIEDLDRVTYQQATFHYEPRDSVLTGY